MPKLPETDNFIVDLRTINKTQRENVPQVVVGTLVTVQRGRYVPTFSRVAAAACIVVLFAISSSPGLRAATIGSKQVQAEGVDNTLLLEADLDTFSMDFKVTGVAQTDEEYIVSYSYVDLDVVDNVWQYVEKTASRRITKPFRRDLGLYLAEQLSQEASARIKELKKEQKNALADGASKVVQVVEYSGLIGKVLDVSAQVFPGYEPVQKIELATPPVNEQLEQRARNGASDSMADVYSDWVTDNPDLVENLNGNITNSGESETNTDESPIDTNPPSPDGSGEAGTNTNPPSPDGASAADEGAAATQGSDTSNAGDAPSADAAPASTETPASAGTGE